MKKNVLFVLLFLPLISGCYTQRVYLSQDKKSGAMEIEYKMDDDMFQILSMALFNFQTDYSDSFDPVVLIDEQMFEEYFNTKKTKGLTLDSVSINEKSGYYTGKIVINFEDFEKTIKNIPMGDTDLQILNDDSFVTIKQSLDLSKMDPDGIFYSFVEQQKEDDINLYNKLTKDAEFIFEINTPSKIIESKGIDLINNKKAIYSFGLSDILDNKEKQMYFFIKF